MIVSKYSSIVMWIGVILILLNLARSWPALSSLLFTGPASSVQSNLHTPNLGTNVGGVYKKVNGKCPAGTTPLGNSNYCIFRGPAGSGTI